MPGTRTLRVSRTSNGFHIYLPKDFADEAGISETSRVEVNATDYGLSITRVDKPHIPLAERLKNWHGQPYELTEEDKVWQDIPSAGDEAW